MARFLDIPQTPRVKTRFNADEDDGEFDIVIDRLSAAGDGPPDKGGFVDPEAFRRLSLSPASDRGGRVYLGDGRQPAAAVPPRLAGWRAALRRSSARFWQQNKSVLLVFLAQVFGALMNLAARLLELEGEGMHPFQLLFVRMSLTTAVSCLYMYWRKVPGFPLGPRDVRWLLVARGLSGFFGIFGMWYSMMYLPLAEATVITFLVPSVAGYICHLTIHDPFTRKEQISSFLALAGVVLIARPTSLFSSAAAHADVAARAAATSDMPHLGEPVSPSQRLTAIGVALLGVLGGSGAITTIRTIGERTHPLISVNYFSTWCTLVTTTVLAAAPLLGVGQPALRFGFPHSPRQWALLLLICLCGFTTQYLMTAGLGGERSNRATAMVYTHMLFAAGFDKWVFGHEMGIVSLVGCGLIIGSALWAALSKKPTPAAAADVEVGQTESIPMLAPGDSSDDEDDGIALPEEAK